MGKIKDRNGEDLIKAEEVKKRWQEYTKKLYKKDFSDPDNQEGVVTHPEADILDCEVKGLKDVLLLIKLVEVMEFQLSYLKSYKIMLLKYCTQYISTFGKPSSGHRTGKGQSSPQFSRRAVLKNVQAIEQLHSCHTLAK